MKCNKLTLYIAMALVALVMAFMAEAATNTFSMNSFTTLNLSNASTWTEVKIGDYPFKITNVWITVSSGGIFVKPIDKPATLTVGSTVTTVTNAYFLGATGTKIMSLDGAKHFYVKCTNSANNVFKVELK